LPLVKVVEAPKELKVVNEEEMEDESTIKVKMDVLK